METLIAWCYATFNTWIGCAKVSEGCAHCYAEADQAGRRGRVVWGPHGTRSATSESYWRQPFAWNQAAMEAGQRRRVFCSSLADVFEGWDGQLVDHKGRPVYTAGGRWTLDSADAEPLTMTAARARPWQMILRTPWLDWLLLTKRPENIAPSLEAVWEYQRARSLNDDCLRAWIDGSRVPDNVWIGTTVENQKAADSRIPSLLSVPARVRFLSMEPLLGAVDLSDFLKLPWMPDQIVRPGSVPPETIPVVGVDWVIVGGESGPDARPMCIDWVRSIRDQCVAAGVAFHFKQFGEWIPFGQLPAGWSRSTEAIHGWGDAGVSYRVGKKRAGNVLDGRTWEEFPDAFGVRAQASEAV